MKNALVTGGAKGIGRAIVDRLMSDGYKITTSYFNSREAAEELEKYGVTTIKCDLTDKREVQELVMSLSSQNWDAIVNNAGVFLSDEPGKHDIEKADAMWHLHFLAPMAIIQGLQGKLNSNAAIVNICSTAAFDASFTSPGYSATKAALINLTQTQAALLGEKTVRVNSVSPGWIVSDMTERESKYWNELAPLSRGGQPKEVANAVKFLLSDEASYITGANLVIDGGYDTVSYMDKNEQ